jgi:hypothetical protein
MDSLHASNYPDTLRNMDRKPVVQDQAQRSRRWRGGVTARLDEIKFELQQLGEQIEARLAVMTAKLAQPEQERRQ